MKKMIAAVLAALALPLCAQSTYTEADLVWMDDFDGNSLNMDSWNYEYHEPGWVNNELQKYVDAKENIYVKDGCLVIQAVKKGKSYTSGRVNTQHKHSFKYGKFEARIQFPKGKGFLPAFWMMPEDENLYGQWPKCGEIDIAEVLGHKTTEAYGTIHYGEPHNESQGKYKKLGSDFASDFHTFACEWEPGEIRFYVDGNIYKRINSWYSKRKGFGEVTYPAPFDQPFYIILNLAVGGNWPGNPDGTTKFGPDARMFVDWVKVYQKKSYNENVQKPAEAKKSFRAPGPDGNYVRNPNFSEQESLADSEGWGFLTANGGIGSAELRGGELVVSSKAAGTADYSVQIIQPDIPFKKGVSYRFSFDASAEKNRTIIAAITAPQAGWIRYFKDTKIDVGPEKKHFEFEFKMNDDDDPDGRVEFNLGNQNSTAEVRISNVSVTALTPLDQAAAEKGALPDGNYVRNGEFQEGENRLGEWTVDNKCGAAASVTNDSNIRKFKAELPAAAAQKPLILEQKNISLAAGTEYSLSFDASSPNGIPLKVSVAGKTFTANLSEKEKPFKFIFTAEKADALTSLAFAFGAQGTAFLDNVRLSENALVLNGSFSSGMSGWEVYANDAAKVDYAVDSLSEDNAFCMNISRTGNLDWMIQLKQNNITLEKGKKYRISLDAKSTLPRKIMYALQRDGSADDNWIPYSGTEKISVGPEFRRFQTEFVMEHATDKAVILSISMGAVDGKALTKKHTVAIDNVVLEEIN